MYSKQAGFTFTGIIIAVTVLIAVGLIALPQIDNFQTENYQAALRSLAVNIERDSSRNHAIDIAVEAGLTTTATDPFINISNCLDGKHLLLNSELPEGYSILSVDVPDQVAVTCTLIGDMNVQENFVIIGAMGGIHKS